MHIIDVRGFVISGAIQPGSCIVSFKDSGAPEEDWEFGLMFGEFISPDDHTLTIKFKTGDELVVHLTEKVTDPKEVGYEPGQDRYRFVGTVVLEMDQPDQPFDDVARAQAIAEAVAKGLKRSLGSTHTVTKHKAYNSQKHHRRL